MSLWFSPLLLLAIYAGLPALSLATPAIGEDWLLARDDSHARAEVVIDRAMVAGAGTPGRMVAESRGSGDVAIRLGNGLVERTFTTVPSFGTVDLLNLRTGDSALRHILPEAAFSINGTKYTLGGLYIADEPSTTGPKFTGQHAFLNRTGLQERLRVQPNSWTYDSHVVGTPDADLPWTPGRRASPQYVSWPPTGQRLSVKFKPPAHSPAELKLLNVTLVYELYDGAPMLSKWLEISAAPSLTAPLVIDKVTTELLALNCDHSPQTKGGGVPSRLDVLLTAAHGAAVAWTTSANSTNDPGACEPILSASYSGPPSAATPPDDLSRQDENGHSLPYVGGPSPPAPPAPPGPPILVPAVGPAVHISGTGGKITTTKFSSFRTIILLHDSLDLTRQMLGHHQIYRRLAPWIQENPLQLHLTNDTTAAFDTALEQMQEVGWETLVLSFGSGFRYEMQADDPYIQTLKANVKKATSMGIEVGGYDLTVLDRGHKGYGGDVGSQWDRVDPTTKALTADACYASGWRDKLESMLYGVTDAANLSIVLTDGPYGGGVCGATNHTHHHGTDDSVYQQYRLQANFYRKLFSEGKFIRQPDTYYFDGGQHSPLGYSEQQYSLPRWTDLTVSRQGLLDDVWTKPAVMGWMFLPMKPYHAGGDGASFEPYSEHLQAYDFALSQYLGSGCGMTYRGDRLYDSKGDPSYFMVKKKVQWFKAHRDILISDIVHVKRPNGQSLDAFLHVNPKLSTEKAMAMVFNPTTENLKENITLPLYYSGLTDDVLVSVGGATARKSTLERDYSLTLELSLTPKSTTWVSVSTVA